MIKYFGLKSSGEIKKTPNTSNEIGKSICVEILQWDRETAYYNLGSATLYELYNSILSLEDSEFGELVVNKASIPLEKLKTLVGKKCGEIRNNIIDKKNELNHKLREMSDIYRKNVHDLDFAVYKLQPMIFEYEKTKKFLSLLERGEIKMITYDERDNIDENFLIVSDIIPLVESDFNSLS